MPGEDEPGADPTLGTSAEALADGRMLTAQSGEEADRTAQTRHNRRIQPCGCTWIAKGIRRPMTQRLH